MMEPGTTKALKYIANKQKRAVWLRAFHIWQQRPHEVAPLSDVTHECSSCKTEYKGNYCPRCGQAAGVGRFSFKKAILLFLDVWGVGNRGMFRSIRDLMLRPGYMIRDYVNGMQSAYFPPFKMFFLLTAFSLLVQHGFNLGNDETESNYKVEMENEAEANENEENLTEDRMKVEAPMYYVGMQFANTMDTLRQKNPAIFALLSLVMFTLPLYFFLRHSPTIPDLRYSEFVVALVYTSNTFSIYSIAGNLLDSTILKLIAALMVFVTVKQFSGYSKLRVLKYMIITFFISSIVIMTIAGTSIYATYLHYGD